MALAEVAGRIPGATAPARDPVLHPIVETAPGARVVARAGRDLSDREDEDMTTTPPPVNEQDQLDAQREAVAAVLARNEIEVEEQWLLASEIVDAVRFVPARDGA